jgi:hypothetical protein
VALAPLAGATVLEEVSVQKLVLISIILANVFIPLWAARDRNGIRGLRKALFYMCVFNGIYLLLVMFAYPRL